MIIGFGALAESLVQSVESLWSESTGQATYSTAEIAPTVVVVDRAAAQKTRDLEERHPQLQALELRAIDMDVEGVEFEHGEFLRSRADELDAVVITFADDEISVVTALTVATVFQEEESEEGPDPCQKHQAGAVRAAS